jgi:ribosomal protein L31
MVTIRNQYQNNFSGPLFGTFTTAAAGVAQNVPFGLTPSSIEAWNLTGSAAGTVGLISWFYWQNTMPSASAFRRIYSATPSDVTSYITTNGVTPYSTSDQLKWVPNQAPYTTNKSTALVITGISKASNASITATHSFTSADVDVTWVTFSQVVGMTQINTQRGKIKSVTSTTSFTVDIDSTTYSTYTSGGQANVITGAPVTTQFGPQVIMSPQRDLGVGGLTLGSSLMVTTNDIWYFKTEWNGPGSS